jgi:hypothetical protein
MAIASSQMISYPYTTDCRTRGGLGETLKTTPEEEVLEADCEPKKADESEPLEGSGLNQGEVQEADCEPKRVDESESL